MSSRPSYLRPIKSFLRVLSLILFSLIFLGTGQETFADSTPLCLAQIPSHLNYPPVVWDPIPSPDGYLQLRNEECEDCTKWSFYIVDNQLSQSCLQDGPVSPAVFTMCKCEGFLDAIRLYCVGKRAGCPMSSRFCAAVERFLTARCF